MEMNMPPATEPGSPATPELTEDTDAGYTLCVHVGQDGQLSAGLEGGAMDSAPDIKTALTRILEIYKNEGKMAADEGDAQFAAGYASRGGMA